MGSNELADSFDLGKEKQSPDSLLKEAYSSGVVDRMAGGGKFDQKKTTGSSLEKFMASPSETTLRPGQVLWDVASKSLSERAPLTGEPTDRDSIFREVNRIMVNSGFKDAKLEGKSNITMKDLPYQWNSITYRTRLVIYTDEEKARIAQAAPKDNSSDNSQTPPVNPNDKPSAPAENPGDNSQTPPANPNDKPPAPAENPGDNSQTPPANPNDKPPTLPASPSEKPEAPISPPPPPPPPPPPETKVEPSAGFGNVVDELRKQHNAHLKSFEDAQSGQGFVGRLYDGAKNTLGASSEGQGRFSPAAIWSGFLDSNEGSRSIAERFKAQGDKIDQLEAAAKANDVPNFKRIYKELTGSEFTKPEIVHALGTGSTGKDYDASQSRGVETLTDVGAALSAVASLRFGGAGSVSRALTMSMGTGLVLGASTKAGLKQIDGRYANLKEDLVTGGIWGMSMPLAEMAGSKVSRTIGNRYGLTVTGNFLTARLETQGAGFGLRALSAAAKSGTAGGVFGASDGAARTVIEKVKAGESINAGELASRTLKGATIGFLTGTALGFVFDGVADGFRSRKPTAVEAPKPQSVNGVDIPASGVSSFDDAAKMMGSDSKAFAEKAAKDPYGAAADAARLFDDTGVNIKKYNAETGELAIPKKFADALDSVQAVDGLTADIKMAVKDKIPVVKAADELVTGQKAPAVAESLEKIRSDGNFKKVLELTEREAGADAAAALRQKFEDGIARDIKIGTAVEQLKNPGQSLDNSFGRAQSQTEAAYLEKAADFFKDMTDPAQRARLNELVDDIFQKFTPRPITRQDLGAIIDGFPAEDQSLALALFERSAANASDVGLTLQMKAARSALSHATGSGIPSNVYTLAPESSGNLLGYLFRKSNSESMAMRNIDALVSEIKSGNVPKSIVLFDDLASTSITAEQKQVLSQIEKVHVVDLGAFEKGVNFMDMAAGPEAVAAKLKALVAEAKVVAGQNKGLLPAGVAQQVLDGAADQAAAGLGSNVKIIRPEGKWHTSKLPSASELQAMDPVDALYARLSVPKASKEEIATFLSQYAGADRELAARMLAEGSVHNSFPAIIAKARQVNQEIEKILAASGAKHSDLLLVTDKDPGGSTHLVSYLFGKANSLSSGNFVSAARLNSLITSGAAKGKVVAYLDDTIYSGSQTSSMLQDNISSFQPFKKVIIGGLGAYEKGIKKINGTHLAQTGKAAVASADLYHPFYSNNHPFFKSLDLSMQNRVRAIGGSEGFGSVQGSQIWSYMYPDNNLDFFGSRFAGSVLRLPGP